MSDMDRDQLGQLLSAHLDGELDDRERAFVDRLLESDDEVRAWYDSLRLTVTAVGAMPRHGAPSGMSDDVRELVERQALLGDGGAQRSSPRMRVPWLGITSAAAVFIAAALVGINQFGNWFGRTGVATQFAQGPTQRSAPATLQNPVAEGSGKMAHNESKKLAAATKSTKADESLEAKLEAGADREAVLAHHFSDESVVLTLALANKGSIDQTARRVTAYLAQAKISNVASDAVPAASLRSSPFYVQGRSGINYDDAGERQLLVRVPVAVLGKLVDQVTSGETPGEQVALKAGSLRFDGRAAVRDTFRQLEPKPTALAAKGQSQSVHARSRRREIRSPKKSGESSAKDQPFVSEVFKALGIAPEVLAQSKHETPRLAKGSRSARAAPGAASTAAPADRDESADYRTNEPLATDTASTAKEGRGDSFRQAEKPAVPLVTIVIRLTTPDAESHKPTSPPVPASKLAPAHGPSMSH